MLCISPIAMTRIPREMVFAMVRHGMALDYRYVVRLEEAMVVARSALDWL